MSIPIIEPKDLGDLDEGIKDRLKRVHSEAWSAITVSDGTNYLIVLNSNHTSARSNSNLAHEIAHVILGHEPSIMFILPQNDTILRTHNKEQEEEANWLAAAILLPRDALIYARERGMSDEEICAEYGVSRAMLRFPIQLDRRRRPTTGVETRTGARETEPKMNRSVHTLHPRVINLHLLRHRLGRLLQTFLHIGRQVGPVAFESLVLDRPRIHLAVVADHRCHLH